MHLFDNFTNTRGRKYSSYAAQHVSFYSFALEKIRYKFSDTTDKLFEVCFGLPEFALGKILKYFELFL